MDTIEEVTIDTELDRVLKDLKDTEIGTKEYSAKLRNLKDLIDARNNKKRNLPSPDTILLAVTNIAGILLMLNFEKMNVISSKALGFILKRPN